jgi:hypothetical protein
LQQSLLEKENNELRELYGELVALHDRQENARQHSFPNNAANNSTDAHAQHRVAELEERVRGQVLVIFRDSHPILLH